MSLESILYKIEHSFSVVYVLAGIFCSFILWATLFDIDETVNAQGIIVANGKNQVIQVADGGVLSTLLVKEGDKVKQGQLLATLEKTRAKASYQEIKSQVAYLKTALARASAEILNKKIIFGKLSQEYPDFMQAQQALYVQKRRSLDEQVDLLQKTFTIYKEEWENTKTLEKTGDVSKLEVLKVRQKLLDIERRIADVKNKYYEKVGVEIEKLGGELSKSLHKLRSQENILEYTDIRAPKDGIIKELKITTNGAVLRPGEQLMEISPYEGGVILEAKIKPIDIGRVKLNMPVSIKVGAFDYTVFGGLKGIVTYISSDTLIDKDASGREVTFYRVNVKIIGIEYKDNLKSKQIKVKLGMSVSIGIKIGVRSLFKYLVKPISRGFSSALTEQ